ncbi:MAG TPA: YdeI/OmpD-associated family protein [Myxococcota bacterium]|nr:YdeI/OmpD-associated family protein [Myxococcota bacterium]
MEQLLFASKEDFRKWLGENCLTSKGVWLLFGKAGGPVTLTPKEALEEALCFGWIDGLKRALDGLRYQQRFTPRRPDSVWSASNKERVARLLAARRMTRAGLALVEAAKERGLWDEVPEGARPIQGLPAELAAALAGDDRARAGFEALAPSYRRLYARWVAAARRPDTRARRVRTVLARARAGLRPGLDM